MKEEEYETVKEFSIADSQSMGESKEEPKEEPKGFETVGESDLFVAPPEYTAIDENAAPSEKREIPEEYKDKEIDANGDIFDEELHVLNPLTGKPRLNKDKTFRKRKRKKTTKTDSIDIGESEDLLSAREAKAAAKTYFLLFRKAGSLFMGKDFSQCDSETEKYMVSLFQAVCEKHNSTGLTAEQMLAIGCTEYTLVKAEEKSCLDHLTRVWLKVRTWLGKKKKKEEEQVNIEAIEEN